jgi:hypothetical protein
MTIIPDRAGTEFVGHDVILVGAESAPTLLITMTADYHSHPLAAADSSHALVPAKSS